MGLEGLGQEEGRRSPVWWHWADASPGERAVCVPAGRPGLGGVAGYLTRGPTTVLVQGFYSENMQQEMAVGLPVSMHLFEYTARCAGGQLALLVPARSRDAARAQPSHLTWAQRADPHPPFSLCAGTRSTPGWTATRRCRSCLPARPPTAASLTRTVGSSTAWPTCCSQTSAPCLTRVGGTC